MNEYSFYGYTLRSRLVLRLLPDRNPDGATGGVVNLIEAETPEQLTDLVWSTPFLSVDRCGAVLVRVAAAGRFLVRGGCEITMQPAPGVSSGELETFLVGVVAGIVLHQRAVLPIHASCVSIGGRAVALAGPAGLGESTLAAALVSRGATLLSDDICAVTFGENCLPQVSAGARGLRLWPDSKAALGLEGSQWSPIRRDHPKQVTPLISPDYGPRALTAVIRLDAGTYPQPGIHRRYGPPAVAPMAEMIYRARLGRMLGREQDLFLGLMRLADAVPIFNLRRPPSVGRIDESVDRVFAVAGANP